MSVLPWRQQGRRRGFGGNEEREKGAGEGQTHGQRRGEKILLFVQFHVFVLPCFQRNIVCE